MTPSTRPDASVAVVCVMQPKPSQAGTLQQALLALVGPSRAEDGCLAYDVYQKQDGALMLFEAWRSSAASATHQQQPAIRAFFDGQLPGLLAADMAVHQASALSAPSPAP